jgi:hypothetical protein
MTINISLPPNAGPQTRALADRLQQMAHDPGRQYSDQDLRDNAIGGLISIVAGLERDVAEMTSDAAAARHKAAMDDLQFRSYGGGR